MRRIACNERDGWQAKAEQQGFAFHTPDGARYWDERAYYGFTLDEIEHDIETPTNDLHAMCLDLVARAVEDERILRRLAIPQRYWTLIAASWKRGDRSLYGRFDLRYDGEGPAKLLEYNADTPTAVFETAVFQWQWLEDAIAAGTLPHDADQFNALHDSLIAGWKAFAGDGRSSLHLAGALDDPEDAATLAYLADTAAQAGLATSALAMADIGRRADGVFVDVADMPIDLMFKLYPWEWMFQEEFGASLAGSATRWVEPPWKAILSNKGILPLLWATHPRHPNLLPAYFEDDPASAELNDTFARKPLYSREGANVEIVVGGVVVDGDDGPYGAEGYVCQAVAPLPVFDGNHAVLGSWIANGVACGLSIREDEGPITTNVSRFLPHAIIG